MTMPDERTRSLRWGAEVLLELQQDATLPWPLRARAATIAPRYPNAEQMCSVISSDAGCLPSEWVEAISDALGLFEEISRSCVGTDETRRSLLFTLRHFPDRSIIRILGHPRTGFSFAEWLQPEQR
jgi:hypothetical protein